ncbi:hypothetical protein LTR53_011605 [Teratosphaeriaceae sp. CCFEE 6253]|nr:hypothetical protein LTR53_011605 [Teratosphaeriaceae sp. CCFEE 6253]
MSTETTTNPVPLCGICGSEAPGTSRGLLTCGRCMTGKYCSKPCQVQDWPTHKLICKSLSLLRPRHPTGLTSEIRPIPGNVDLGALTPPYWLLNLKADPKHENGYTFSLRATFLKHMDVQHPGFRALSVTTALGYPLSIMIRPRDASIKRPNIFTDCLTLDPDPASDAFGQRSMPSRIGGLLLAHRDGMHMQYGHVVALVRYLRRTARELREILAEEDEATMQAKQDLAEHFLTPMAFAIDFELQKFRGIQQGNAEWEELECPVQVPFKIVPVHVD